MMSVNETWHAKARAGDLVRLEMLDGGFGTSPIVILSGSLSGSIKAGEGSSWIPLQFVSVQYGHPEDQASNRIDRVFSDGSWTFWRLRRNGSLARIRLVAGLYRSVP